MIVEIMVFLWLAITAYCVFLLLSYAKEVDALNDRLERISALETPKGSATSKKMARIARGEG